MFIVLEGADGTGKETQAKMLKEKLESQGKKVLTLDFPDYSSEYGKLLTNYLRKGHHCHEEAVMLFIGDMYARKEDIEKAHVQNVYEFLNQQTSIIAIPSYGNPFSQKLDIHGYGVDGYQNIIIRVNGRKINI